MAFRIQFSKDKKRGFDVVSTKSGNRFYSIWAKYIEGDASFTILKDEFHGSSSQGVELSVPFNEVETAMYAHAKKRREELEAGREIVRKVEKDLAKKLEEETVGAA